MHLETILRNIDASDHARRIHRATVPLPEDRMRIGARQLGFRPIPNVRIILFASVGGSLRRRRLRHGACREKLTKNPTDRAVDPSGPRRAVALLTRRGHWSRPPGSYARRVMRTARCRPSRGFRRHAGLLHKLFRYDTGRVNKVSFSISTNSIVRKQY